MLKIFNKDMLAIQIRRERKPVVQITITGLLLGLMILFQFLSSKMNLFGPININLTWCVLIIAYHKVNWQSTLCLLAMYLAIGPAVGDGYTSFNVWGNFIGTFSGFTVIVPYMILWKVLFNDNKVTLVRFAFVISLVTIINTVCMILFNMVVGYPIYYYLASYSPTMSISDAIKTYEYADKVRHFMIPNYYQGIAAAIGTGNVLNDVFSALVAFPVLMSIGKLTYKKHLVTK